MRFYGEFSSFTHAYKEFEWMILEQLLYGTTSKVQVSI